jgi:hypothetical protein
MRPLAAGTAAALLAIASASSVSAQYFGQNKVQYHTLNFKVLETQHFDIYFYPREQQGAEIAARLAERWHARLERLFEHTLRGRQPLLLYASHTDFEQTNAIPGELGEGTGGVTEPLRRRIVLPLAGALSDTDHVLGHELVHAFQFDVTSGPHMLMGAQNGAMQLPLWFIEGMAEYVSLGPVDANTAMWLRDAVLQEKLPTIDDLNNPKYFPYRWGQAFWAYVGGRWGDDVIKRMLVAAELGGVNAAIQKVLGTNSKDLSTDWHAAIRRAYEPVLAATAPPLQEGRGRLVIKGLQLGAELNVGPAISPDGRWIAFLSARSFFSTDLYIADASTGRIVRRLTSTASDPHYSSIQFIYSAGAWDRDSKRIAIATITGGQPALAIFNAETGNNEREVKIAGVDEVINPTWAPDGHAICFTGMIQGLTDLFVYDLNTATLRRLTNDAYADLEPAWSPDGRRIAFATDRFSTSLGTLAIGQYRIALIDPEEGTIEQVRAFTSGKNINPQWAPDGRALYFLSDRDGIPNLYRLTLASGAVTQLTRVGTGVSGITSSSPALSVSSQTGLASFSVYEGSKYNIYTLLPPEGDVPLNETSDLTAAALPPIDRTRSAVEDLLSDAAFGLPPARVYDTVEYKPKLSLEGIGQPMVGVGASRYGGTAIGGSASFFFGDMLGDHNLAAAVQLSAYTHGFSFKDSAALVEYLNRARRWNWGVVASQIPYVTGGVSGTIAASPQGGLIETDQTTIYRQTYQSAGAIVAYPLDRARRLEFQGGAAQISFDQIVQTTTYSLQTGERLTDRTATSPLADSLTLGLTSAAYVFDTASYGATSPVQGQRYRLEVAPTFGTINYNTFLADYRRYFMPVSFYTIAGRILQYGRYGSGSGDPRLYPLYIGYPGLVRGYDAYTFDLSDCPPNASGSCAAINRLLGSRMLVGNLELRFPLLRPFKGVSPSMYGPVPTEVAVFTDAGVAWNAGEKPTFLGGTRHGVGSAGVAVRVNVFSFLVSEIDFVKPFQRTNRGFVFQFNFVPGF